MFSSEYFFEKKYNFNILLPKVSYPISKMYEKYILKLYDNGLIRFITYLPNIKYKNFNFKLHSNKKLKKYKVLKNNSLSVYGQYIFLDFLNVANEIIDFIGNEIEDILEQRNTSILFYIHKTLLFCENLIKFSPVLNIYCSNMLQICDKLFYKYKTNTSKNFSKYFIELFEDLYNNLISSLENTIEIINATFINYTPKMFEISLPRSKVFLKNHLKYEMDKENLKNYKTKYYTYINSSQEIYYINNISEFVNVCLYQYILKKVAIRKCENCNNYFISQRRDTKFCDNSSPQNPKRSCSQIRNHLNKRQKEQNIIIQKLYDNISNIYSNNKSKKDYILFWKKFKQEYNKRQNDIIYQKYTRNDMIKWLNSIKSNPLQLAKEKEERTKILYTNTELKEYKKQLKILGLNS